MSEEGKQELAAKAAEEYVETLNSATEHLMKAMESSEKAVKAVEAKKDLLRIPQRVSRTAMIMGQEGMTSPLKGESRTFAHRLRRLTGQKFAVLV